ncbi:MAG TPA: type II CAAX endopeptidase family protein [Planctomycetota bacterium]|nr:type II CAAX endopeptidase family protein [Planctomycetota bacterium]
MSEPPPTQPAVVVRRGRLALELVAVLLIVWLPYVLAAFAGRQSGGYQGWKAELRGVGIQTGFVALILILLRWNRESWRRLGIRRFRWWAELLWAALLYIACWINWLVLDRMLPVPVEPPAAAPVDPPETPSWLLFAPILLVNSIFEEVFVRGYLWDRLRRLTGSPMLALGGSALLFTAYHPYSLRDLASIFVFGLILGYAFMHGRSLPRLIVAHTLFNLSIIFGWA